MKRGARMGNRNAAGARKPSKESAQLTELITLLYDQRGLSFGEIRYRLEKDFAITISRAAVWQRYQRGVKNGA